MVGLIVLLVIILLFFIIVLIDSIIEKYFCNMLKYRIVKIKEDSRTKYVIQRRFLWFFWIYVGRYPTSLYTLEEVKQEIERLKIKSKKFKTQKEVLYEE